MIKFPSYPQGCRNERCEILPEFPHQFSINVERSTVSPSYSAVRYIVYLVYCTEIGLNIARSIITHSKRQINCAMFRCGLGWCRGRYGQIILTLLQSVLGCWSDVQCILYIMNNLHTIWILICMLFMKLFNSLQYCSFIRVKVLVILGKKNAEM